MRHRWLSRAIVAACPFVGACDGGSRAAPADPLAPLGQTLPRIGTVGDVPSGRTRVFVDVTADGGVYVRGIGGPYDLEGLRDALRPLVRAPGEAASEGDDSQSDVVIAADRRLRWDVVNWVVRTCASEPLWAYRTWFAAVPEDGSASGAFALFCLHAYGRLRGPEQRPTGLSVWTGVGAGDTRDRAFAELRRRVRTAPTRWVTCHVAAPRSASFQSVLEVADLAARAGCRAFALHAIGAPAPKDRPSATGGATWIQAYVAREGAGEDASVTYVARRDVRAPEIVPEPPPPVERAKGRTVGFGEETESTVYEERFPGDGRGGRWMGTTIAGTSRSSIEAPDYDREDDDDEHHVLRLCSARDPNGAWTAQAPRDASDPRPAGPEAEAPDAMTSPDSEVTARATLSLLLSGWTRRGDGAPSLAVSAGISALLAAQDRTGRIGAGSGDRSADLRLHGIATVDLVYEAWRRDAYGMPSVEAARRAIAFAASARGPDGAWGDDATLTAWMGLAFAFARQANRDEGKAGRPEPFDVPQGLGESLVAWVRRKTDPGTGRVEDGVARADGSTSATAAGLLLRALYEPRAKDDETFRRGIARLAEHPPRWEEGVDLDGWFFAANVLLRAGGDAWRTWSEAFTAVQRAHRADVVRRGRIDDWDPIDLRGARQGRVGTNAMIGTVLSVVHRYDRGVLAIDDPE